MSHWVFDIDEVNPLSCKITKDGERVSRVQAVEIKMIRQTSGATTETII